jgi:signal transduction histidine kinase
LVIVAAVNASSEDAPIAAERVADSGVTPTPADPYEPEWTAPFGDSMQRLMQAVVAIGSQLDFADVPHWIVSTAADIADAEYAALGVLDPSGGGRLSQFITVGMDDEQRRLIGDPPLGRGVLGLLIDDPRPIRLADIAAHPSSHGFPAHHPPMRSFLGVPIRVSGEVFGNLYLANKRGDRPFSRTDERLTLALATAAGLVLQNAQLHEQARHRQEWLAASRDVTTMLLSGSRPHEVFARLVAAVRELAGADTAFLTLPATEGTMRVEVADGYGAGDILGMVLPERSLSARIMSDIHPVAVRDARFDQRIWQTVIEAAGAGPAIFVPLGTEESTIGTLVVTRTVNRTPFTEEVTALIETFAGQAALALRLGAAAQDRAQVAILSDRDRIARDLHDLVIQRLFATGMSLEGALRASQGVAVDRVHRAVDDLDATIREIRTTIFELQAPATTIEKGVRSALLQAIRLATGGLGFEPKVQLEGPIDLLVPPSIGEQLVAVIRETLSNTARHAEASAVTITVTVTASEISLSVQDDGVGLPTGGRRSGLNNLSRRAADLGGQFDVHATEVPLGTLAEWTVPMPLQ